MKWENNNHVMYGLNIHPAERLDEIFAAIKNYTLRVKAKVCPDKDFGLGLRLSQRAARELLVRLEEFRTFLHDNQLYVVTINGFPFGSFHGTRIKENVYLPDWSSEKRVAYTMDLAKILANILPEGEIGTISTVPFHYGKKEKALAASNLLKLVVFLKKLEEKTGRHIIVCLEPEPDCYLDLLESTVEFFEKIFIIRESARRYLGICLDCCHAVVEFESPLSWLEKLVQLDISVAKIQISSAIRAVAPHNPQRIFMPFNDKEYLHQVRISSKEGILRFKDLPDALSRAFQGEWRVHFHVPLLWSGYGISSTTDLIEDNFFRQIMIAGKRHIEIETYSYMVLPGTKLPMIDSIASELEWLKEKFDTIKLGISYESKEEK